LKTTCSQRFGAKIFYFILKFHSLSSQDLKEGEVSLFMLEVRPHAGKRSLPSMGRELVKGKATHGRSIGFFERNLLTKVV
jgi:hypothetical protein